MTTIAAKTVTHGNDFHRLMDWGAATKVKCSEFGDAIIKHMTSALTSASKPAMAKA